MTSPAAKPPAPYVAGSDATGNTRAKRRGRKPKHARDRAETTVANGLSTPERKTPVPYSEEIADLICQRLREGESLLVICSSGDLPSESAVRQWAADPSHSFAAKYAHAREIGYLKMADEVIALSDGLEAGDSRFEPGVVQRHRLMVDSRKWVLSKALPKIYGDRFSAEVTGAGGGPVQIEAAAAVRALLEALPDLGVLSLDGSATAVIASDGRSEPLSDGGRS